MQTISPSEAAKRLNVSPHTIKKFIEAGLIKAKVFPSGRLRIAVDDLQEFFASLPTTGVVTKSDS
jgi:excisionase family DNA binding protein